MAFGYKFTDLRIYGSTPLPPRSPSRDPAVRRRSAISGNQVGAGNGTSLGPPLTERLKTLGQANDCTPSTPSAPTDTEKYTTLAQRPRRDTLHTLSKLKTLLSLRPPFSAPDPACEQHDNPPTHALAQCESCGHLSHCTRASAARDSHNDTQYRRAPSRTDPPPPSPAPPARATARRGARPAAAPPPSRSCGYYSCGSYTPQLSRSNFHIRTCCSTTSSLVSVHCIGSKLASTSLSMLAR